MRQNKTLSRAHLWIDNKRDKTQLSCLQKNRPKQNPIKGLLYDDCFFSAREHTIAYISGKKESTAAAFLVPPKEALLEWKSRIPYVISTRHIFRTAPLPYIYNLNFSRGQVIIISRVAVTREGKTGCNVAWNGLRAQTFHIKMMTSRVHFCQRSSPIRTCNPMMNRVKK